MSKLDNINYNKVNIKTDSMVKMIEQLAKLGVFKEKKKPRQKRSPIDVDEVKQPSDMVGYTKTISPAFRGLTPIIPGMTQQQIDDIQQRNAAAIAALQGEVQQQRLQDIETQQGQRFADITRLGGVINPLLERFRGAQEPGAGQRPDPFAPAISQEFITPDIPEGLFTQTINEGGPEAVSDLPETTFAEEEEVVAPPKPRFALREPVGGGASREFNITPQVKAALLDKYDIGDIPTSKTIRSLSEYLNEINKKADLNYSPPARGETKESILKTIRRALRDAYLNIQSGL
jgi:hypothetical protein